MKKINENIKRYRLEKKLTQQEVADQLFVTRQCVSRWEQGKSVPDLEILEKLAKLLEITINELIDDDSIKTLTINEAINNRKNKKFIWISLMISALAVFLTIGGYIVIREQIKANDLRQIKDVKSTFGIITKFERAINKDGLNELDLIIRVEKEDATFDLNVTYFNNVEFYDLKSAKLIHVSNLRVGDTIEIEYKTELKSENITKINIIDAKVDKSLLGVVLVANGKTYNTIEEIINNNDSGLRFYLYDKDLNGESTTTNIGLFETKTDIQLIGDYLKYTKELNVYYDRLKLKHDIKIGLIYSTGIEYVETIEKANIGSFKRVYNGEIDYKTEIPYSVHSVDITYNLKLLETNSLKKIEVYEYDMNNKLIKTTNPELYNDISIKADENAIYSFIKITSENDDYAYQNVHQLKLGENLEIQLSDEYGLVSKTRLHYTSYTPRN